MKRRHFLQATPLLGLPRLQAPQGISCNLEPKPQELRPWIWDQVQTLFEKGPSALVMGPYDFADLRRFCRDHLSPPAHHQPLVNHWGTFQYLGRFTRNWVRIYCSRDSIDGLIQAYWYPEDEPGPLGTPVGYLAAGSFYSAIAIGHKGRVDIYRVTIGPHTLRVAAGLSFNGPAYSLVEGPQELAGLAIEQVKLIHDV